MIDIIKEQLNNLYEFRYNNAKRIVEYRVKGGKQFIQIRGVRERVTILNRVRKSLPFCTSKQLNEALLDPEISPEIDPFVECLESLPEWDGQDWIEKLSGTVRTDDDQFWRILLRKFLYAMVKCLIEPEYVNQFMLVLVGGQGIGKSTWLSRLVPKALKDYVHNGPLEPKNKDDVRKLAECMLINLDELDAMGRHNSARLKELITRGTVNQRKPFGSDNEIFIRRASFVASLNNYQFLHDQTGNRRFWVVKAFEIDRDVIIEVDQLYAQVYSEVKNGANEQLTPEESMKINERNQNFVYMSPLEEAIHSAFEAATSEEGTFYRATDIANAIKHMMGMKNTSHGFVTQVGTAMSKSFQVSRKGRNDSGYYLCRRSVKEMG